MKPDWESLKLHPTIVEDLRARYEDIEATLSAAIEDGNNEKAEIMRGVLARIEEQAATGAVGDEAPELTPEDEEILDRVWATPKKELPPVGS